MTRPFSEVANGMAKSHSLASKESLRWNIGVNSKRGFTKSLGLLKSSFLRQN